MARSHTKKSPSTAKRTVAAQAGKRTKKSPTTQRSAHTPAVTQPPQDVQVAHQQRFARIRSWGTAIGKRRRDYLSRRPHRSFRLSRRRDYKRGLAMPGYFAFTIEVAGVIWQHKKTFATLGLVFMVLTVGFGLLGSQDIYSQLQNLFDTTRPDGLFTGAVGEVGRASILLLTTMTNGLTGQLDPSQQFIAATMGLYMWLSVVWLLRKFLAGKKVVVRDALYTSGAPIIATLLCFIILLVQMIPAALATIVVSVGYQTQFIDGSVAAIAVFIALVLLIVLSLYWATSTFIALVIVTLPGMRPLRAVAIAGDLVIGRRLRILLRLLWLIATILSWWLVIMVPVILFDTWLKSMFTWLAGWPIVPVMVLVMTTATIMWSASYIYLLYRKIVDDDTAPAL